MSFQELHSVQYSQLRRDLLRDKGSDLQKEFLEALRQDGQEFLEWMRNKVGITVGNSPELSSVEPISEDEFKEPTKVTEAAVFSALQSLEPRIACRPPFWGRVALWCIETKKIGKPSYLAANGGTGPGGSARIDEALKSDDHKKLDSAVRTVLRRLSGLPEARGNRSVYVDCPLARAWWRCFWARECASGDEATEKKIINVFRTQQNYWEELVNLVISRNSVLGDAKVRKALIQTLAREKAGADPDEKLFQQSFLKNINMQIGIRAAIQELGVFSIDELRALLEEKLIPLA